MLQPSPSHFRRDNDIDIYGNVEQENRTEYELTDLIHPILLTYNSKLVHSATGLTPKEARDPSNELEAYANMKLKAKHNRKYLDELATQSLYT